MRRIVSFSVADGAGDPIPTRGTIADLLEAIPYMLVPRLVPPWRVVNDLLRRGGGDAGMSGACAWEPFEITQAEWADVASDLDRRSPGERCEVVEPPDWVQTIDDWDAWVMIYKYGLPEAFRELDRECRELERARERARRDGDADLAEALHLRAIEAGERLSEFVMKHRPGAGA